MLRFVPRAAQSLAVPPELLDYPIQPQLLTLLCRRGFRTKEALDRYLHPQRSDLYDPFLLQEMDRATEVIRDAIRAGEAITVFGDYDVDGVTATAILLSYLRHLGGNVDYYIPDRHGEGYGLNADAVEKIAKTSRLLITVDCGITCTREVALARKLGMRVIVTDHHQIGEELPDCEAVINPLLGAYPFRRLCGAGVAFKIVQALGGAEAIAPYWDLAALATIADIVPLIDENRVIVKYGLEDMLSNLRPGIQALMETAGMMVADESGNSTLRGKTVTSADIAFRIAPRINAGGRLAKASRSVELLLTEDLNTAREIAGELDRDNEERRKLEQEIFMEADRKVHEEIDFLRDHAIVILGEGWNTGVIGLAAARLVEKYRWPTILLSDTDGVCVGSARSITGVDIYAALSSCSDLFDRFGGHSQAAGLTIRREKVEEFRHRLNENIWKTCPPEVFIPSEEYDLELKLSEISDDLVNSFSGMQPTGFGNQQAVFYLCGVRTTELRRIGKDSSHLRMRLVEGDASCQAIGFRMGEKAEEMPEQIDAIVTLSVNEWMGNRSVQCELKEIVPFFPAKSFYTLCGRRWDEIDLNALRLMALPVRENSVEETDLACCRMEELPARLGPLLSDRVQGVIFTAHSTDALQTLIPRLAVHGIQGRIDYALHIPRDPRGFHTLVLAPYWWKINPNVERIVLLDGLLSKGEEQYLRGRFGPEKLLLVRSSTETATGRLAGRLLPDDEELRKLWRLFKSREGNGAGLTQLAAEAGCSVGRVMSGLQIFRELGLVQDFELHPLRYRLIHGVRTSLSDSALRGTLIGLRNSEAIL
ncbi:MAG: single-stranded-DNA-specific exonuclease RecJ [Clostridiales bacterium]|nr:single-stranded-DNA-specific exonuclease RecJ [Clostridiales bacterium]